MLIDCPHCKSSVDAKEHGSHEHRSYDDLYPSRVVVGSCPSCGATLVGQQDTIEHPEFGDMWSNAERLWPNPKKAVPMSVPDIVKVSLQEADTCFNAGAYSATAVMCGRALEAVCVHFAVKSTLQAGLKELLDKEIIDKRLHQWGDELRKVRNLGAHATTEKVSARDAHDVLDFSHAIAEYVFVLNEQFNDFMERRAKEAAKKKPD